MIQVLNIQEINVQILNLLRAPKLDLYKAFDSGKIFGSNFNKTYI
jgi:hypothetical protein